MMSVDGSLAATAVDWQKLSTDFSNVELNSFVLAVAARIVAAGLIFAGNSNNDRSGSATR